MEALRGEVVKAEFEAKFNKALYGSGHDTINWNLQELINTPYGLNTAVIAANALKANKRFGLLYSETGQVCKLKPLAMTDYPDETVYKVHLWGDLPAGDRFLVVPKSDTITSELYTFFKASPPARKKISWPTKKIGVTATIDGGEPVL